jgi:hypothetical protein
VFFTDKNDTEFDPYSYFDTNAIERRLLNGISLFDSTDFPLNQSYVDEIAALSEEVSGETRWFNALAVFATDENIVRMQNLPFVKEIVPVLSSFDLCSYKALLADTTPLSADDDPYSEETITSSEQVARLGGEHFIKNNIDGKGIRIAVFDGGFPDVDTHPAFEHIRKDKRIIKTWNFCHKKENVYGYHSHGRMVLSCIAGINGNEKLGLATGAEFLLAKTELASERFKEEVWWMMAVEWADKNGAHIINSSLGYAGDRYYPSQMDGKHTLVTRAANMAASKGILVVNAAGNEGLKKEWARMIIAPADADSILSVGGISPHTDYHIGFSSIGPTADGRLKPNVSAWGEVSVAASSKGQAVWQDRVSGTSFSSPLVAGFAACAWQTQKQLTNMQLKTEIEHSADLYPYFDYDHGYGVPQADYFTGKSTKTLSDSIFYLSENDHTIEVVLNREVLINSLPYKTYANQDYVYYHIQNEKGVLVKYLVLRVPFYLEHDYLDDEVGYKEQMKVYEAEQNPSDTEAVKTETETETEEVVAEDETNEDDTHYMHRKTHVITSIEKSELKAGYVLRVCYNGIVKEYTK